MKKIQGQASWNLRSDRVDLWVTRQGGQLAPAWFGQGRAKVQPFAIAPWAEEKTDTALPPMLKALRGDFFCLPFGGNAGSWRGERHPPHGETANAAWKLESAESKGPLRRLRLSLGTRIRPGRVDKEILLRAGHRAIYARHTISGMSGRMCLGHHPCLQFPDEPGSGRLSHSGFSLGQVYPGIFENPRQGGFSALKPGATFSSLEKVPLAGGGTADLSRYPARRGFEDLVLLTNKPLRGLPFAWTAVTFPALGHVFLTLKDPAVLRQTVLWHSNGGRNYEPWNGRHLNVLGMEEVTAHFHEGLARSAAPNSLTRRGQTTCLQLNPRKPLVVNFIMACLPIPAGFDVLARVLPKKNAVVLVAKNGAKTTAALNWEFLFLP